MDRAEAFKEVMPDEFLRSIYHSVFGAYSGASEAVKSQSLGDTEQRNLIPWTRRAHVENNLRGVAEAAGISVETRNTGFWNHVVVSTGGFRLTQSVAMASETSLRPAGYKRQYAQEQLHFEFELEDEVHTTIVPQPNDPHHYAVVLHHASIWAEEPDFVLIRFPNADLSGFHEGEIDLSIYAGTPVEDAVNREQIDDAAMPSLKPKQGKRNG